MRKDNADNSNDLLAIGRLGAPNGVEGFLRVQSYSGETAHFLTLSRVVLARGEELEEKSFKEVRLSGNTPLALLEGCTGPEDASRWTGWEIRVPRSQAAPRKIGEYYAADLEGCSLTLNGRIRGTVRAVVEGGGGHLLEVQLPEGRAVFVPFRGEFVGKVDTEARELELLVDWILE